MNYPRLVVAATQSGTGKTTITQALILALLERGFTVQPYKTGPDYIDPGFHTLLCNRESRNLDTRLVSKNRIVELFARSAGDADISIIEGVMGLYDGAGGSDERGSTAHLAKIIKAPVLLVMDVSAMARSAGAMAYGFARFENNVNIDGFIVNNVGSEGHYSMVKEAIEGKTGLPVFGYIPKKETIRLPERHLGLVPAWEKEVQEQWKNDLQEIVSRYIDLDAIIAVAQEADPLPRFTPAVFADKYPVVPARIGYAYDEAFHFYYADNLDLLRHMGAELVPFSPLKDSHLPEKLDGIYFGGGYPELYGEQLQKNLVIRQELLEHSRQGLPIYAECGGLMYLMERLVTFEEETYNMVGVFSGEVRMEKKLGVLGYYQGELLNRCPAGRKGKRISGHVYHWSRLAAYPDDSERAFVLRKPGKKELFDGFVRDNTIASYLHIHFATDPTWPNNFLKACNTYQQTGRSLQPYETS